MCLSVVYNATGLVCRRKQKKMGSSSTGYLMELDSDSSFTDYDLEQLWDAFGDTAINDLDEIEEPYLDFPAGTYRFDIWHWFDERYSKGVYFLAYGSLS